MHIDEVHLYSATMNGYHVAISKGQVNILEIKINYCTKNIYIERETDKKKRIKQWKFLKK